jgi:hypothetical protein
MPLHVAKISGIEMILIFTAQHLLIIGISGHYKIVVYTDQENPAKTHVIGKLQRYKGYCVAFGDRLQRVPVERIWCLKMVIGGQQVDAVLTAGDIPGRTKGEKGGADQRLELPNALLYDQGVDRHMIAQFQVEALQKQVYLIQPEGMVSLEQGEVHTVQRRPVPDYEAAFACVPVLEFKEPATVFQVPLRKKQVIKVF